jgi:transcription initiation factor TFIID subunit 13
MSYTPYTPTPPPAGQTAASSATYAYGSYPYSHPQTPGTYTYPAGAYQAGVTGYGWTYPYSYVPQHPQAATLQTPRAQGVQAPVAPYTPATTPTPQRTTTFTAYAPNYAKENVSSSTQTQTGAGRGGRRQSNLKGLFTKERKLNSFFLTQTKCFKAIHTVKNLMYGFGDERNPANDTVSVMEEILIEYITDVVCLFFFPIWC